MFFPSSDVVKNKKNKKRRYTSCLVNKKLGKHACLIRNKKEIISSLLYTEVHKIHFPMFLLGYPMALHLHLIFETYSDIFTTDSFILLILWLEVHHT